MNIKIIAFSLLLALVMLFFCPLFSAGGAQTALSAGEQYIISDISMQFPINAARCAAVIDSESGNILYLKNADEKRGMASTTKIMTALVAIENGNIDCEYAIPKEAVGIEGSSVYLKEGERLTLRELLYCLMLESGNDAAEAIAIIVGGSSNRFVELMNERASELELKSTRFANPHGLSDENHYTTARELAIIAAEAMKYPLFCEIVGTKSFGVRYDGQENGRRLTNHNKLLFSYKSAIGVKTGYTKLDGKCLVSAAESEGRNIVCVTLQDPFPTATHRSLLDFAFESYESVNICAAGEICVDIPISNAEVGFVKAKNPLLCNLTLPKGARIKTELSLPDSLNAPICRGDIVGKAHIYADGKEVYVIYLESTETVLEKKKSIFDMLFGK